MNHTTIPRRAKTGALLLFFLVLTGCSALQQTYGIPATDLSWLKRGLPRTGVESRLGPGEVSAADPQAGATVRYEFNRGYHPPARDNPLWWPVAAVGWESLNLGSLGTRSYWERECQKARLEIRYTTDDLLAGASEQLPDLDKLRRGTQDICDRIRAHLLPSTLDIQPK